MRNLTVRGDWSKHCRQARDNASELGGDGFWQSLRTTLKMSMLTAMNDERAASPKSIEAAGRKVTVLFGCLLLLGLFAPASITLYYLVYQDLLVLAAMALIWLASIWNPAPRVTEITLSGRMVCTIAALTCLIGYAGHYWLLDGYALSRDEQMALFDSQIYGKGQSIWPLPPVWQHNAQLLNTSFMAQITNPVGWVSGYLPGNAMLRALLGKIADPALTGGLLTGLGVAMTWLCARRLWPEEREPAAVACLLVALSGQVQITGMTAYAMPAHLAINMVWLWLFLRGRWSSDIPALAVGFIATGLHQPLFHPLFIAPWLVLLLWDRDWKRLALYTLAYLAIALFWLAWPHWQLASIVGPNSAVPATDAHLIAKLAVLIGGNHSAPVLMSANLVRFLAWQPVILTPLAALGWIAARRDRRAAAVAGGLVLTILVMLVLIAYQGHGFGYRYLHGLIGSAALLAAFGWRELGDRLPQARTVLLRSLVLGAIVVMPLQAWFGHSYYQAYATTNQRIAASSADYVLIGEQDASFSADLVINRPDLANRPLRLLAEFAPDPAALARLLCKPGVTVALPSNRFFSAIDQHFGTKSSKQPDKRIRQLTPVLQAAGCRVILLD